MLGAGEDRRFGLSKVSKLKKVGPELLQSHVCTWCCGGLSFLFFGCMVGYGKSPCFSALGFLTTADVDAGVLILNSESVL